MHCFGHVHDEVGVKPVSFHGQEVMFSNAAMDLKRAVNMFTFEVPVDFSSETYSGPGADWIFAVEGLDLVLDLDAADPQQEMVFLWRKLPGQRPNQLWQLQQTEQSGERYALRSMCNGQMLRHMSSDIKVSDNLFAYEITWATDGLLMSPTGCTVLPPRSLKSGQTLGMAPVDLQEALKFSFVPVT
eukprot:CAMPEP_0114690322 /NCGR_PEP_ID=MMETSP0191-20121206/65579_1 /TAXON_ID=126664 /ORGANISM="Sorites sp." /LENGTH=185 /DNA_ID=CAMNT_0001980123 /DNA_START=15 /DNA_END=573 /DNA_ORIENTATION=-